MVKRLIALLFIFVIAGQVSAGVCGCIGGGNKPKHSCCKRKKAAGDVMSAKGCCGTNCMVRQSQKVIQDRTASAPEIKFQTVIIPTQVAAPGFRPMVSHEPFVFARFSNNRLKYPRPPDLYLLHQAFLI
jgi:hypothetical protein